MTSKSAHVIYTPVIKSIPLSAIDFDEARHRQLDPDKVKEMADSLLNHGQLQPIGVREYQPSDGGPVRYARSWGGYRLAAMKYNLDHGVNQTADISAAVYPPDTGAVYRPPAQDRSGDTGTSKTGRNPIGSQGE